MKELLSTAVGKNFATALSGGQLAVILYNKSFQWLQWHIKHT